METLILVQTIFYGVFSVTLLVLSVLLVIVLYYLVGISKHLKQITLNAETVSDEIKERILEISEALSRLPVVSMLFKPKGRSGAESNRTKGRKKSRKQ